jgi:hypothetical protein
LNNIAEASRKSAFLTIKSLTSVYTFVSPSASVSIEP